MRFYFFFFRTVLYLLLVLVTNLKSFSQEYRYNSLFWEITGNGLAKPSYLFGTMHISNKMVFHLSDSFYTAIRNVDVVAIEINPESWQSEIPRFNKQSETYKYYNATYYTDYLKENSFTGSGFIELLQQSLRFEPVLNDQLLYRNERGMDNFQEDTYLDLYIYQTGKKLGKQATGVETFAGSQRMVIEAYVDMAKDQNKNRLNDELRYTDITRDMQDAYRRGDLNMLDSLNKITEQSPLFTEKFLYQRNEIQANAMDSIMKIKSLFAGVGAAHLPGSRGVIELLRKKGYTLRPIYMLGRDTRQKAIIDSMTVPVHFTTQYAADSFYKVDVPGQLNDIDQQNVTLHHYADMANGSYYLITRIRTDNIFNGYTEKNVLRIVDSLLYENIPGQILSKQLIVKSGYEGWDIINRTRKNDMQRYQIWVTPFEILIFKMGGPGKYVYGDESSHFFNSIAFRESNSQSQWQTYSPSSGGFEVRLPSQPMISYTFSAADYLPEWRYESLDSITGDRYSIIRKSIYSFDFIGADTFDLKLIAESFCSNTGFGQKPSVTLTKSNGRPVADITLKTKDGTYIRARAVLIGPQYYLLVNRSRHKESSYNEFFHSFVHVPFKYPEPAVYTDSFFNFSVRTPIRPVLDKDLRDLMIYMKKNEEEIRRQSGYSNNPVNNYANFVSEETGEVIVVNVYTYPEYYYAKDSTKFWQSRFNPDSSLVLKKKLPLVHSPGSPGWLLEFSDTASTRIIKKLILMKGNRVVTAHTMTDTTLPESTFIRDFYTSLQIESNSGSDIFKPKTTRFFNDYNSTDSLVQNRAKAALSYIYFGAEAYPGIKQALRNLKPDQHDYIEQKNALITELGYIDDSAVADDVIHTLQELYRNSGDTILFTNSILKSLSRLMYGKGVETFKNLLLQDPPVFEDRYEYIALFGRYTDSLNQAAALYPELLNLATIEEFKEPVRDLLVKLTDSNLIQPGIYEDYVGNIFFDAKISLKKLQRQLESNRVQKAGEEQNIIDNFSYRRRRSGTLDDGESTRLMKYTSLLIPYYDKNPSLPQFFDKLLQLDHQDVRMKAALDMLKAGKPVADSIWKMLARKEFSRLQLWNSLKQLGHTDFFPATYRLPEIIASDALYALADIRPDSMILKYNKPVQIQGRKGNTYFFKYRWRKSDDWKIAFSTLLLTQDGTHEVYNDLVQFTSAQYKEGASGQQQMEEQLKKAIMVQSPSGRYFYTNTNYNSSYGEQPLSYGH